MVLVSERTPLTGQIPYAQINDRHPACRGQNSAYRPASMSAPTPTLYAPVKTQPCNGGSCRYAYVDNLEERWKTGCVSTHERLQFRTAQGKP